MGKTLVGLGTGIEGMQADPDVMPTFMSAEMAIGGVIDRCIANIGRLNLSKLRNFNKFVQSDKDQEAYNKAMGILEGSSLDIFEENTVPAIRARMRQRIKDNPGKKHICIIDFLTQLRSTDPTGNQNIDYGNMVLDLKQMAKDLDIPVILLVQLNRQNEMRADKTPTMSDIRDTGVVEQAGDIIIFLHREYYYDKQADPNLLEINIAKNRQGQTGIAKLGVEMKFQRFYDLMRGA
jgi:replicative DNA helicase